MSESASDAPAEASEPQEETKPGSGRLFGGLTASEAARRSAETRRARAAERAQQDADAALTFRQRLAVSLSRLSQDELDAAVAAMAKEAKEGKAQAIAALARMADQAFGKPQVEEEEQHDDEGAASLTRAQRAALIARLLEEEEEQRTAAGIDADPRADGTPSPPAPPHPRG